MDGTSSSEFVEWIHYINLEPNHFHAIDWYFAQLTAEVRRSWVSDAASVKTENFLLKWKAVDGDSPTAVTKSGTEEALAERIARSKAAWFGATGYERK